MKGFVDDIEQLTEDNDDFRRVLYTGKHLQLVLMSLRAGEEIGEEVHEDRDQFFRVEDGEGAVVIDGGRERETTFDGRARDRGVVRGRDRRCDRVDVGWELDVVAEDPRLRAVVLLKGPATIVASPDGDVLVSTAGDARLATLGTGDVLAGVVAALCAGGLDPFRAAAAGAFLHGRAGALGWRRGFVASDLLDLLPAALEELTPGQQET